MEHTFDVAIRGMAGLPSAAQLLDLGLHAPIQRYLRYHFPGEVWGIELGCEARTEDMTPHKWPFKGTC